MLNPTSAIALVFLIGIPGLPGLPFPKFKRKVAAVPDSVQTPWKSASRLALENQLVFGSGIEELLRQAEGERRLNVQNDQRRERVEVDPDSGEVVFVRQFGEVPLGEPARQDLEVYSEELVRATFRKQWAEKSRQSLNSLGRFTQQTGVAGAGGSGLSFQLPGILPQRVQNLLGPGSPAINVSGSENIRISGQSNWSNQQTGPIGQKRSLFPTLDMQQDLNIRLEGQLSDRIKLNLLQNSLNQIPLANTIAINYKGDEDDLIQGLDLGNTNLSLPGTQYVSYSGRNEGLFGVKATTRMGPLDFTVLASKQEGRSERASYAGGSQRVAHRVLDSQYIRGVYFLLYDPSGGFLDIPDTSIRVYKDDGVYTNTSEVTIRGRAFLDPNDVDENSANPRDSLSVRGNFRLLNPGPTEDYEILHNIYGSEVKVLKLRQPLTDDRQRLAVTFAQRPYPTSPNDGTPYTRVGGVIRPAPLPDGQPELWMKLIRPPQALLARDSRQNFRDDTLLTVVRHLELKNFYQLPGQEIDARSLKMTIELGVAEPPLDFVRTIEGTSVPYIEVLGLDNADEVTGTPVLGHDNRVDAAAVFPGSRPFVDYKTGVLFFLEPRPFAPRTDHPFERALGELLNRRARLDGSLSSGQNDPNPVIYDRARLEPEDSRYRIAVEFTAQTAANEIQLGRGNILEGSEVVTVNGRTWVRNVDYDVDYDLGRITLKRGLNASDNLNIDYSYAPLFQQAGRTLLGSAFRLEGFEKHLGGAFMYESRGAQDLRPRLGEEPSRSLIGDLNGEITFRPDWMTRMIDRLPGVRTTTPSELRVQAEVGASFPNPNTRNEVFLDDMEGVRDAVSLGMAAERWRPSSVPSRMVGTTARDMNQLKQEGARIHNAELRWYSPFAVVKERDLKPNLSNAEGAENNRQVLALSVPRIPRSSNPAPVPGDLVPGDSLWVGLTYPLDAAGLDLSKSQFIELWINDWNDYHEGVQVPRVRGHRLKLHIDLGTVSEDQQRAPNAPPNRLLDTEDPDLDGQLVVTDTKNDDRGYDGRLSRDPGALPPLESDSLLLDLVVANQRDPEGDDFIPPSDQIDYEEIDPRRFRSINGTEGNKSIFPYPDTEDLNGNAAIDFDGEAYYEYTIDLGDDLSPYLVTDVRRDYGGCDPAGCFQPGLNNGWRRYRIPIADSSRVAFGLPDLAHAQHVRLWVEGIRTPDDTVSTGPEDEILPLLVLGALDIVGSRWRTRELSDSLLAIGSTITLNSVNTVDNADRYVAPFDPGETRSGNQAITRREQSIALEFERLRPGMTLEAFRTYSIEEDYTRYRTLAWYVAAFQIPEYDAVSDTGLKYFVRFSSDELGTNYYEYRARMPQSSEPRQIRWDPIQLALTNLSNLKLAVSAGSATDTLEGPGLRPGEEYRVVNRPSFTRIRRISFGLVNTGAEEYSKGEMWFDELRALDVEKSTGIANRVLVNGRFANLLNYSATFDGRDADFVSVGETRGRGFASSQTSFSGSLDIHRFFEGTGIVLPFSYTHGTSGNQPRFTVGDDVVRTGAFAAASESRSVQKSWQINYSRTWSERSNPLLRYTLGGITAGMGQSTSEAVSASSVDTTTTMNANVNWRQSFRKLLAIPMPLTKGKLFPLPSSVTWAYNLSTRETRAYDRLRDSTAALVPRNLTSGRAATLTMGMDLQPIDLFTYHVDALRNLSLPDELSEKVGGANLGRVVAIRQNTAYSYRLNRGAWLQPSMSWNTSFMQDNGPGLSPDLSVRAIQNNQAYNLRWSLPFESLKSTARPAPPPPPTAAPRDSGAAPPPPPPRAPSAFSFRSVLSRIGNVETDFALNRSSNHSRVLGQPDFFYLFGFSSDPGFDEQRAFAVVGNQSLRAMDWRAGGRTRVALVAGAALSTSAEFRARETASNGVEARQDESRFPEFTVEYGKLPSALRLDKFLTNPQIRTAYNRSSATQYLNNSNDPSTIRTSSEWRPLLSLRGDLKNGTKIELGIERRNTQSESFQLGHSITTERFTNVNVSLNRSYTQGQKVTVLGKTTTVRSSINMGVSASYEKKSGETEILQSTSQIPGVRNPNDTDRLSVNGTGQYGFSSNVTGNLVLGFFQDRDNQRDIIRRQLRIELRGSFNF
jgi:hypothetical protein